MSRSVLIMAPTLGNRCLLVLALFVFETAQERVVEALVNSFSLGFGESFVRLQRVVNDNGVRAATGKHSAITFPSEVYT